LNILSRKRWGPSLGFWSAGRAPCSKKKGFFSLFCHDKCCRLSAFSLCGKNLNVKIFMSVFWAALVVPACSVGSDVSLGNGGEERPGL